MLAAAVIVPAGLALRGEVFQFLSAAPAPDAIERDFASMNRGFIGRISPDVIAAETRRVLDIPAGGGARSVLWVAPRVDGGFCWLAERVTTTGERVGGVGGCGTREGGRFHAQLAVDWSTARGQALTVTGRVRDRSIARLELVHEDGASVSVPIVWVSEPIGVGFFLHPVPAERLSASRLPREVVAFEADAGVVKRERLRLCPPPSRVFGRRSPPVFCEPGSK